MLNPMGPSGGKWYHEVWSVLALLFFVLGPFGLPILWKSPRFSPAWKWFFTALTLLYTAFLIWFTGSAVQQSLKLIQPLNF